MRSVSIDKLDQYFAELLKKVPQEREAMFRELGEELLKDVRSRIGGAGKVQSWQEMRMGSQGGYVKVWPKPGVFDENGYAAGYVTNAITSGHRQTPGRFVPRLWKPLKREWVPGKHFYADAKAMAPVLVDRARAKFEARLKEAMG